MTWDGGAGSGQVFLHRSSLCFPVRTRVRMRPGEREGRPCLKEVSVGYGWLVGRLRPCWSSPFIAWHASREVSYGEGIVA